MRKSRERRNDARLGRFGMGIALLVTLWSCRHVESTQVPSWVPSSLRTSIDDSELAERDGNTEETREGLERALGVYVAAYRAGPHAGPRGRPQLCELFEAAALGPTQIELIHEAEKKQRGVVFVAYTKPLVRRTH